MTTRNNSRKPAPAMVAARKRSGFSQRRLATLLGQRSMMTVSNWETGRQVPRLESRERLATVLQVPIEEVNSWFDTP